MSEEQRNDPYISNIISEFEQGQISDNNIFIHINDNILYKLVTIDNIPYYAIYLPKKYQNTVIREYHEHPMCGHFGHANTYQKIRTKYYWPLMYTQIKEFTKNCHSCQINKINRKTKPGYCDLLPIEKPFSRVEIDITGPLDT